MSDIDIWKDATEVDAIIDRMADELRRVLDARGIARPLMVGIRTGGVWVAERLHRALGLDEELGTLDISFYRDDFTRIGLNPEVHPSSLPVSVEGRHLILVDDVLHTGRTVRAALNELFDYGRPDSVILVALAVRDGRELPIAPDVAGVGPGMAPGEPIKLTGPEPLVLRLGADARKRNRAGGGEDAAP